MAKRRLSRHQARRVQAIQERRRRQAQEHVARQAKELEDATLGAEQSGIVIAQYGNNLIVENPVGDHYPCVPRQNLGALVCGDRVIWQPIDPGSGVVTARMPRDTMLARPDYGGRKKSLAANLDQIIIVAAPRPELSELLIDRYLVAAELTGIPPLLLINKIDLLDEVGLERIERRLEVYQHIGYPIIYASTRLSHGLDDLIQRLSEHTSMLVGQSGVGKSSLVATLLPEQDIRTGALSSATGLGRHVTSTATLYRLSPGGALIDSPGVRNFHLWDVDPPELIRGFREFQPFIGGCQFRDCRHEREPGCALRAAVEEGKITAQRLASYKRIRTALESARAFRQ